MDKRVTFSDVYIYHTTYEKGSDFRRFNMMDAWRRCLEKQRNEILLGHIFTKEHIEWWHSNIIYDEERNVYILKGKP